MRTKIIDFLLLSSAVCLVTLVTAYTLCAEELKPPAPATPGQVMVEGPAGTGKWVDAITQVRCPPKVTSCKIVVITDQEEQTLVGPDMIFAHAQWANRVKLDSLIQAWIEKLRQAPQGVVQTDKIEDKK